MKIATKDLEFEVRPGTADDIPLFLAFIRSMAEFEKLEVSATEELLKESLFGDNPAAQTLLAFVDGKPAAYVVYFFTFSTMVGKRGLWLEDVFVEEEFRGKGLGRALMACLADIAVKNKCARFEWVVLDWNKPAINLYEGLGATAMNDWNIYRFDGEEIAELARQMVRVDGDR